MIYILQRQDFERNGIQNLHSEKAYKYGYVKKGQMNKKPSCSLFRFYKKENTNPSSKNWEMSEQAPCKDKSKFSGTFYIRQTFRENKTYVNTRFCKFKSKQCVARTNFFLRCMGQKVLYFSSSHISKLYCCSTKCLWLLQDIFLSAFVLLYSQVVTIQEHCSTIMRMFSDYWYVTTEYQHCYEMHRNSMTYKGHYLLEIY